MAFYCIDWPWRWKQYDSLKHQELHNQQYNLQPPLSMWAILLEQPWRWTMQAIPQHRWLYRSIHGITSHRTWISSNTAVGTSKFTSWKTIQTVWRMQSSPMKLHYFERYHKFVKCYRDLHKSLPQKLHFICLCNKQTTLAVYLPKLHSDKVKKAGWQLLLNRCLCNSIRKGGTTNRTYLTAVIHI